MLLFFLHASGIVEVKSVFSYMQVVFLSFFVFVLLWWLFSFSSRGQESMGVRVIVRVCLNSFLI